MPDRTQMFLMNLLTTFLWCFAVYLSKLDEKAHIRGFTSLNLLTALITGLALIASVMSGVATVIAWRRFSWFGRCFGLIAFIPGLVFFANAAGWIERLPFGIRF